MEWSFLFLFNSIILGIGLAADAFSVALTNGLHEPEMCIGKMCTVAGTFAFFQALMPFLGWICIHTIVQHFRAFEVLIPWIALVLLCYIGGKMLHDSLKSQHGQTDSLPLSVSALLLQGIATSIDALSAGFTIAEYTFPLALSAATIIACVTFAICITGVAVGKKAGVRLSENAGLLGGILLIFIGLEIFISSWF